MNYETVVTEMLVRLPKLRLFHDTEFDSMGKENPGPYIVFGSVLLPVLEKAMDAGDLGTILPICAFLEDVAEAADRDVGLNTLLRVEVGAWLKRVHNEASLSPWLGSKTKRICRYVPGLATQRIALRAEARTKSFAERILRLTNKLKRK